MLATLAPPTSSTTLRALREAVVLPVVELFSAIGLLLVLLLAAILCVAVTTRTGLWVAGPAGCGFDPVALVVRQVGHRLGEGEQHLALDTAPLGPGTARPAAGLPGPCNEAEGSQCKEHQPKVSPFSQTDTLLFPFFFYTFGLGRAR